MSMPAKIINGRELAAKIRRDLQEKITKLRAEKGITPGLAVILVGDNPAQRIYVEQKRKASAEVGIYSEVHHLNENVEQAELLALIEQLNANPRIHGILVQLPLPKKIDENVILSHILPEKDVDGYHPLNLGKLTFGCADFIPCTPAGIITLLKETKIELIGKQAVVVGSSNVVGKPTALMLLAEHATVTVCHIYTTNLAEHTRQADILVVAIGKPNYITGEMIKPGAVVIDVGINRVNNKVVGDVEFVSASQIAGYITPVPGGVGPMTIAMLLKNTFYAATKILKYNA